jgi:DNA mismatch repair protein MutH
MKLQYNPNDKDSIISFAKLLIGKSVGIEYKQDIPNLKLNTKDKGRLGKVIEELYFKYKPNPKPEADFKKAGLELKSAGLLKQKRKGNFVAKERLVLNIIDYELVVKQNFEIDFLTGKNAHLLLVFYLYEQGIDILESIIKLVGDWSYNKTDLEVIRKDWEFIQQKVADGKAHELSEGDTFYLGACTKGATALSVRKQPYCIIPAKQRAYSLKPKYVNHIIANISNKSIGNYGKLIPTVQVAKKQTIEEIVISKFKPYYGNTIDEILAKTKIDINTKAKSFYASLTKAILGIELNQEIEEFEKAEIIVKTVRLKENDLPKEDISFPNFKYETIVNQEWDDTDFKDILEHKFLFVFYQFENDELVLRKVKFWNMPYIDILEAEKVWTKTKEIVSKGNIVKEVKKGIRYTNFPNKSFNSVSHVRPHATNADDTYTLPTKDKVTKLKEYTKHCFWLNNTYVRDEIYLK